MKNKKELLDLKKKKQRKNPEFVRQDIHKKKRLKRKWRKPRGEHSKKRLRMQSRAVVSPGHGTPKELRHTSKSGKQIINVKNLADIEGLNPKNQAVIVARKTGMKKKLVVLKQLIEKEFEIINIKDPKKYVKLKEDAFNKKKEDAEKRKKKESKKKESKKDEKVKDKKQDKEEVPEEEKKKIEKKEIDKLLTKKT